MNGKKSTRAQVIRHRGEVKDKKEHKARVKRVLNLRQDFSTTKFAKGHGAAIGRNQKVIEFSV